MTVIQRDPFPRRVAGALLMAGLAVVATAGVAGHRAEAPRPTVVRQQKTSDSPSAPRPVSDALTSTARPRLPADISRIWLVPERQASTPTTKPVADFAAGMRLFSQAKYAEAQPLLASSSTASTPVAAYAAFYGGLCSLNLSRVAEARTVFARLHAADVPGFILEAAIAREAEAASAQGDNAAAARLYDELSRRKTANPDAIMLALGRAWQASGDRARAAEAFARLYYEFPLSDLAAVGATELDGLKDLQAPKDSNARFKLDLGRAERLFGFKRYLPARLAFEALAPFATGDDAEVIALRLAESDFFLHRYRQARDDLAPRLERSSRKAEARFFHLASTRELGEHDEYVRLARGLVTEFPDSPWAEETLNSLATHYIVSDDDEQADLAFRELYTKFPQGAHAERAAWKAGWRAYKHARYQDTIALYESAAATFPRSDYRPAYLYWSGRAREQAGDKPGASAIFHIVTGDYLHSYYGRLASKRLQGPGVRLVSNTAAAAPPAVAVAPPTGELIKMLLSLELYEPARDELLYAQRTWGDNPVVGATLGWVCNKQGELQRGIYHMKRAYPQYMSDEGQRLPVEALRVIFPLDYWSLIRKYAPTYHLDPFLVAALINQESAFDAGVKSSANAVGLMQILPSTGRRFARDLRVRRYSAASLTRPEVNIQIGMAYFAELIRRFGGVHHALASYNAGERRVDEWNADRQGLDLDEYIDDIPFPETQTYVKKILGTAEDYRRLYADDAGSGPKAAAKTVAPSKGKPATPPAKKPPAPKKKIRK